ncbi:N-acetyl-gamma-glutamyl-phosphate reductase [Prochlorococcus marinus str. MIT 9515]|uniref:N-acetyl-gamma-glutamyl-phosphate reductase n=1 Tax=Prochlorococcus marinus (strain MIT 9515) TaxID=167542 RepID=ARGC_PROM5|nr:N-acetyl-gamma-glutamyl-phosphate reductase [Prochlorococcus marinus]A2BWM0.1 RecName: Full=N-acetyl-gamma-glutamyl-phosphate reductase; Short=AGPR; AltName: Full=N-acetyl-glutamate semialdehyde dehydrogenase; Short=NAGSA dehydrogenase [Prochlorococcus marinus str. MIT 9515]ABM72181.1 N-acetyl-gamma-glutamyl-phosphate reductase [Prochlorococcus marinus str. MIT 9515]
MNVAIVGATGYGGIQSVNLLKDNKNYKISYLGGYKTSGTKWSDNFPFIKLDSNNLIEKISIDRIADKADVALLCLPNGISSTLTRGLLEKGVKVIDLSADYRYKSLEQWKRIYSNEAAKYKRDDDDLCKEAVYGLPEINNKDISKARLIACPGCYPTSALIPLIPFLSQGIIDNEGIIIDSKSGTSGGGRESSQKLLFSECGDGLSAYGLINHRHTSEIEQIASFISGNDIELLFTPHLLPMIRGMHSTIYGRLRDPGLTSSDCRIILENFYRNYSNIRVLPVDIYPSTKWVKNTNEIHLSVKVDNRNGRIILLSVIDNLLKGQTGQAIQNLNLISGLPLNNGLEMINHYP